MKQYKLMGALALTGAFALALSGCATGNTGSSDKGDNGEAAEVEMANYNPQPRENLKEGGDVNFAIREVPDQLNAFNSDGSADTARVAAWYTPQIILMKPDGTQYKNDNYLSEWKNEVKDGKTVLTFTFTDEAHWNDGTDMDWTAIDVDAATQECIGDAYTTFVGVAYQDSALDVTTLVPTKDSWEQNNDRVIQCIIFDPAGQTTGSLAGAAR